VLATVKGRRRRHRQEPGRHILTNSGYEVVTIIIEQPVPNILDVAEDKAATCRDVRPLVSSR
jgi:cobalamin-dependent methionine synthase I